MLASAE